MSEESLIKFPCVFPIKIMGKNHHGFHQAVIEILKKHLDDFFNDRESYNNEMLADFLNKKTNKNHTEKGVMFYLEWYARLGLGQQIHDCIKEHGQCHFDAEI